MSGTTKTPEIDHKLHIAYSLLYETMMHQILLQYMTYKMLVVSAD